jgi:hypothetical protein
MDQRVRIFTVFAFQCFALLSFFLLTHLRSTERYKGPEQRCQLPPDENVPQGLRTTQARRSSGLERLVYTGLRN